MRNKLLVLMFCGLAFSGCNKNSLERVPSEEDLTGLIGLRIEPEDLVLESSAEQPATQVYRAIGQFSTGEREVSSAVMFHLENRSLGQFAQAQFTASKRQGGDTKVFASAGGLTAAAHLIVRFSATVLVNPMGGKPLPADPKSRFTGAASAARAPKIVYPNSDVILPPNIQSLEVHFLPGAAQNELFQLSFQSPTINVTTYTRCGTPVGGGCIFPIDEQSYGYVASSTAGGEAVKVVVRGSDDAATGFGESSPSQLQFAQENVSGGLYYWNASGDTGIMRVDFGSSTLTPSLFLSPTQNGFPACVGCHAISRDGTRMVASLGGQNDGRLVYIADMKAAAAKLLTLDGNGPASSANHIQFASFSPTGNRFVAIYGDTHTAPEMNTLFMHDGDTGLRIPGESIVLNFEPDHPDWSPSGTIIAFTHVGLHETSQRARNGGIDVITQTGSSWSAPATVVPIVAGTNRFNPSFAPDSSFLVYTETLCPGGDIRSNDCDSDGDPPSKTWAVKPQAGATPLLLGRAAAPGITDGAQSDLTDTFPRFSPFQQKQGKGRLFWVTISSRRKAGLRDPAGKQWLWMFAVDPDKVAAGQDGSYPAFYLPFQDLTTSNHIAQWTQKVVTTPG